MSPGVNGLSAKILKEGEKELESTIVTLIKNTWKKEKMPNDKRMALLCPVSKNGDRTKCENYRQIALLDVAYKILSTLIILRERERGRERQRESQVKDG